MSNLGETVTNFMLRMSGSGKAEPPKQTPKKEKEEILKKDLSAIEKRKKALEELMKEKEGVSTKHSPMVKKHKSGDVILCKD